MKLQSNAFRDYTAEQKLFVRRALVAFIGILLLSCVLIFNLYHLQILRFDDYSTRSNENRIKLVPVAPSRGIIYDRNGVPLALNRTIYQAELVPEKVDDLKQTLQALRPVLDLTDDDIDAFEKERKRSRRFTSIPVKTGLNEVQVARFAVNQYRFPGVEVKGYQRRYYPYGQTLTHVVGYVSKINDRDVKRLDEEGKWPNYAATHDIGKLGIENYYEDVLHGKTGYEEVEVNNRGRVIRQLHEQSPQAGRDIWLTVDLRLQQYIETLLTGSRAAVVVSDPRTGEILALVSTPSYDPNLFVDGISSKDYKALLSDENRPLYNRALQAAYPPRDPLREYLRGDISTWQLRGLVEALPPDSALHRARRENDWSDSDWIDRDTNSVMRVLLYTVQSALSSSRVAKPEFLPSPLEGRTVQDDAETEYLAQQRAEMDELAAGWFSNN